MQNIFKDNAPLYWEKGLPVIPLHKWNDINEKGTKIGKAPFLRGWEQYANNMPSEELREEWLSKYPTGNIGLPLGKESRCVALDIDSENPTEIALIEKLVPKSPWSRVGKKGKVLMFRYNGERTFRIKDNTGRTICELLSEKTQVVLPPSIHPDTQQPYTANCKLYDVVDQLPKLPSDIETILRGSFQESLGVKLSTSGWTKTIDFVSHGSRDTQMTRVAGLYSYAVLRGEMTLKEAMEALRAWCETQVEPVAGDNVDVEKGVRNIVKFLMRNITGPKKKTLPKGWDLNLTEEEKKSLSLTDEDKYVAWDFQKIKEYVRNSMEKYEQNTTERTEAIEYAVERIARSNLSVIEEEQCLKHIVKTNNDVTMASLRKRINEIRACGISGMNHTEIARATLKDLNDLIPDEEQYETTLDFPSIRFYNDKFWQWNGSNWEELTKNDILKHISNEYGDLKAATRNSDHLGILSVMKSQVGQQIKDIDVNGVNFANGFVDTKGVLHKHSKKWGCTYTLPYRYIPELGTLDNCPRFKAFLESVWGEDDDYKDKVKGIREVIASTIFGYGPSLSRVVLLYGIAGSGKSQLLDIVRYMLPDEIVSCVSPYKFDSSFDVVSLSTATLNVCGELDNKKPIPGALFKQIVDGSEMEACYKFGQNFKFRPRATHWFASNHLPKSGDTSEGFYRRWLIFKFKKIVKTEEKVLNIGHLIAAEEREAIAAWAIGCMTELVSRGDYTLSRSHLDLVNDMAAENDSLFSFMSSEQGPRLNKSCTIQTETLYDAYRKYSYAIANAKPVGLRKFYSRLNEMGIIFGFSVDNYEVRGLTMEKENGTRVSRGR